MGAGKDRGLHSWHLPCGCSLRRPIVPGGRAPRQVLARARKPGSVACGKPRVPVWDDRFKPGMPGQSLRVRQALTSIAPMPQAIRQNLRSPTLTPKRICRLVGMSRSQLYRLFEPMGGVARYIQAERLREAHRALANPDNLRDIHEVAEDLGFFDASAFSRIFRREYGCTPSEVRSAALAELSETPLRRPGLAGTAGSLTELLQLQLRQ